MKKILIFSLCIIISIVLVSCDNAEHNSLSDNELENSDNLLGNPSQIQSNSPPIIVRFSSFEQINAFINASNGSSIAFDKYADENDLYYSITQKHGELMSQNISSIKIPILSSSVSADGFSVSASYNISFNTFTLKYEIDGILYRFHYSFDVSDNNVSENTSVENTETTVVVKDLNFGTHSFDLRSANGRLVGSFFDGSTKVHVTIFTDQVDALVWQAFDFGAILNMEEIK